MQIAIVGAGRIGSTFAWHLARAGHEVTVIARGQRLAELERDGAIESVGGVRATVKAAGALDPATPYDLVVVTVLAHQVEPLLPALAASRAQAVLFMFNTFASLAPLRDAVGAARFSFAFPTVTAVFVDGKLKSSVSGMGKITTVSEARWAALFKQAGIPTEVQPDMESFLRSHVAFVLPLMLVGNLAHARQGGVTWGEARRVQRAMAELFAVVRRLGNRVIPGFVATLGWLPAVVATFLLWSLSRSAAVRELGAMGPGEPRALVDAVAAVAPEGTGELRALRP